MYDTLNEFARLRTAVDQMRNESFVATPFRTIWSGTPANGNGRTAPLPLDVYATDDAFVVVAAAPGLRPEDLNVSYNQGTLTLSGQIGNVAESEEAKPATWYLHELWHGRFQRTLTPPFEVDPSRAEASFEHGVLRISLPKAAHAKPRQIPVRIAGTGAQAQAQAIEAGEPAAQDAEAAGAR
jgi:HSP20 family molecular chaperone IbpA